MSRAWFWFCAFGTQLRVCTEAWHAQAVRTSCSYPLPRELSLKLPALHGTVLTCRMMCDGWAVCCLPEMLRLAAAAAAATARAAVSSPKSAAVAVETAIHRGPCCTLTAVPSARACVLAQRATARCLNATTPACFCQYGNLARRTLRMKRSARFNRAALARSVLKRGVLHR